MQTGSSARFEEIKSPMDDENMVGLMVGVVVGLITLLLIWLWTSRRNLGREVLICGACDSGKTTLLSQLVSSKPVETYTSMQENRHMFTPVPGATPLFLVDIPGHERIRGGVVDKWAAGARGIVFVVDSSTVTRQVRDVTEFLYSVLSNPTIHGNRPGVLVLCNKDDLTLAKSSQVIRGVLEKEIDKVRVSRSSRLESQEGELGQSVPLGRAGKAFEFQDLGNTVTFAEGSAMDLDTLKPVTQWLKDIA